MSAVLSRDVTRRVAHQLTPGGWTPSCGWSLACLERLTATWRSVGSVLIGDDLLCSPDESAGLFVLDKACPGVVRFQLDMTVGALYAAVVGE